MQNLQQYMTGLRLPQYPQYPTSQEIMEKPIKHRLEAIEAIRGWKITDYPGWKDKATGEKLLALYRLITSLSIVYNKPVCVTNGHEYHYSPLSSTIILDSRNPSIISTLHEFAHHIKGPSESKACKWSVWLFKKVFPKAFAKLEFIPNSHMLCKRKVKITSQTS